MHTPQHPRVEIHRSTRSPLIGTAPGALSSFRLPHVLKSRGLVTPATHVKVGQPYPRIPQERIRQRLTHRRGLRRPKGPGTACSDQENSTKNQKRNELLIFITPRIVTRSIVSTE